MLKKESVAQLKNLRSTTKIKRFADMVAVSQAKNPLLLISEGDSWFDYPGYNLIDHVEKRLKSEKVRYKILRLESNGDEAVAMLSSKSRHRLSSLLKKYSGRLDILFFSGGGNDIAGEWDLPFVIREKALGNPANSGSWINKKRLDRRMKQIEHAYLDLVDIRDDYSPNTVIVTHTYDEAIPSGKAAKFALGLIKKGPWLRPYLKHINESLHQAIIDEILGRIRPILESIAASKKNFHVASTHGTLKRDEKLWDNELHPTKKGFKLVGEKLWDVVVEIPEVKKRLK